MKFFKTSREKKLVEEFKNEVNTHSIFNKRDKEILNPMHDKDLKKLDKKKLPYGIRTKNNLF